ncbi:MAG: response regulator [Candidatus Omnitrophica bacterium]|nr:response regulator [Candidatus Omnitrophota bacterium]
MSEIQNRYKVLMVDDEEDIVHFFTKAFENFNHIEFFSAIRAAQGIEIAKSEKPHVILLDLRMPGINGEEALIELKKTLPDTKFIVMTGWEDGATRERIEKQIGVAAYYTKPVNLEKVITKIINLLMVKG